jgi:hypothetical protein
MKARVRSRSRTVYTCLGCDRKYDVRPRTCVQSWTSADGVAHEDYIEQCPCGSSTFRESRVRD